MRRLTDTITAGAAAREPCPPVRSQLRLLTSTADRESPDAIALDHRAQPRAAAAETPIRVLVGAGQELMRATYRALLESDEGIQVVGEAASCQYARTLAKSTAPDVAVLDLEEVPGPAHLDPITAIVSESASAGIASLLIAPPDCDERILTTLRAGAAGVLSRDAEPAELTRAVRVLARGQTLLPASALRRLIAEIPAQSMAAGDVTEELAELTDREREVVVLVAKGLRNSEIAHHLTISPATAKTHVHRAMLKLDVHERSQLVVIAYETGLAHAPARRIDDRPWDIFAP